MLKSLELFRNGLKSVTIITFEELLGKLEYLLEFLRTPPASEALTAEPIEGAVSRSAADSPAIRVNAAGIGRCLDDLLPDDHGLDWLGSKADVVSIPSLKL